MRSRSSSPGPMLRNPLSGWQSAEGLDRSAAAAGPRTPHHSDTSTTGSASSPRHAQSLQQDRRSMLQAREPSGAGAAASSEHSRLRIPEASASDRQAAESVSSDHSYSSEFNNSNIGTNPVMEQLGSWRMQRAAELEKLLVKQDLQPLCKKYKLPATGKKHQLIERVLNYEAVRSP